VAEAHNVLGFGIALLGLGLAFSEFLASCIGFLGLAAGEDQASRAEERGEQSGGVGGPELGGCAHLRAIDRIDQDSREGFPHGAVFLKLGRVAGSVQEELIHSTESMP